MEIEELKKDEMDLVKNGFLLNIKLVNLMNECSVVVSSLNLNALHEEIKDKYYFTFIDYFKDNTYSKKFSMIDFHSHVKNQNEEEIVVYYGFRRRIIVNIDETKKVKVTFSSYISLEENLKKLRKYSPIFNIALFMKFGEFEKINDQNFHSLFTLEKVELFLNPSLEYSLYSKKSISFAVERANIFNKNDISNGLTYFLNFIDNNRYTPLMLEDDSLKKKVTSYKANENFKTCIDGLFYSVGAYHNGVYGKSLLEKDFEFIVNNFFTCSVGMFDFKKEMEIFKNSTSADFMGNGKPDMTISIPLIVQYPVFYENKSIDINVDIEQKRDFELRYICLS